VEEILPFTLGIALLFLEYMEQITPLRSGARPFRFGVVAAAARSADDWLTRVRRIEALGFNTLLMPDNLQYTLAPLPALAAAAAVTSTLRLGTYVLANDLRNPVLLAKDAATLDLLSGGRLELGLGAGRPDAAAENRVLGLPFDSGAVRVARLGESLAVLKALLSGQRPPEGGAYYAAAAEADVSPRPVQQPHPPILVAGAGRQMLSLAAREADIVALGLPPTATDAEGLERVEWIRAAAGERFSELELSINLMGVGDQVPRWIGQQLGLTARLLAERGSIAAISGSLEQMCQQLVDRRQRLGLSYVLVSDELMEAFAPIVERLSGK
jgi:probable F420-dependent oxidoreductase